MLTGVVVTVAPSNLTYPARIAAVKSVVLAPVTPTVTGTPTSYALSGSLPTGLVFSTLTGVISGTPTDVAPETTLTVTATNPGGSASTTFILLVASAGGEIEELVQPGPLNSVIVLSTPAPVSGESMTVSVNRLDATSIALTASGAGCGAIANRNTSTTSLSQTAAVGSAGECNLSATVSSPTGTTVYAASFTVQPSQLSAFVGGITFEGGTYFPSGNPASFPTGSTVSISSVSAPQSFVNGGSGALYVSANSIAGVNRAIVTLNGFPGYFLVPVTVDGARLRINLSVSQSFLDDLAAAGLSSADVGTGQLAPSVEMSARAGPLRASGPIYAKRNAEMTKTALAVATPTSSIGANVRLIDSAGRVTTTAPSSLNFQAVNAGTVQFSLSWDQLSDVDLHVVTPTRGEIYYGRRSDGAGGSLDLDSNAGCRIDRVNNENISWSESQPPEAGRYIVRVDYWSNCGIATPVNYVLTVTNCGVSTTYTGILNPGEADRGGAGSGRTIANIDYAACAGLSVKGKATYDDIAVTSAGIASAANPLPIRSAVVQVRAVAGDSVLGTGTTDDTGNYSIRFTMANPGAYYVNVLAQDINATPRQKVINYQNTVYSVRSAIQDASTTPRAQNVLVRAIQSDGTARAFNIFDVGVTNFKNVAKWFSTSSLSPLTWQWASGITAYVSGTDGTSAYFGNGDIRINGSLNNPDENDDSVIAHEFGHFVIRNLSVDRSAGGNHPSDPLGNPLFAWSEGTATFWGARSLGSSYYLNYGRLPQGTGPFIVGGVNIETPNETPNSEGKGAFPAGTRDGSLSGDVSEFWVAAILFDLADSDADSRPSPTGGFSFTDGVASEGFVFDAILALKTKTHNRGVAGPDLVDFLDEWLCRRSSIWNPNGTNDFRGTVVGLDRFPYAPDAPLATPPIVNCA